MNRREEETNDGYLNACGLTVSGQSFNPIHPKGNSLKEQKPCTKV